MKLRKKKTVLFDQQNSKIYLSMPLERPDPPEVGKVTHHTIELKWDHVKLALPPGQRYKYVLQESDKGKKEWGNVYSGYSTIKVVESLQPTTEYSYRLAVLNNENERSEYSVVCTVKTTSSFY